MTDDSFLFLIGVIAVFDFVVILLLVWANKL